MGERRKLTRTRVRAPAQIILDDKPVVECTVRDLTISGAGIETAYDFTHCSRNFDLTFDSARSLRHCRLVWQKPNRIGVEFVERA
jgi:hypothetical protein